MRCESCGAEVASGASYCPRCGAQVVSAAPAEGAEAIRLRLERALGERYEILRLLGRGGMGAVYLARERALERLVAIKVLPPQTSAARVRRRFQREARTAAALTHPNIVPLHSFGEAEGLLYFVMGHVQGESLGDRLRREPKLAEQEAQEILAAIADALDYAHRHGVVHRDIKPDNILIDDETGRPLLTDFGIARPQTGGETLTETGTVVGTPHYMSPEQALGQRELDGRSDLYSLAVVGYQMLTGSLPFAASSAQDLLRQLVTQAPTPIEWLKPDISPHLAATITRCLAKSPSDRCSDGRAFREAVTQVGVELDELAEDSAMLGARWVWIVASEIALAYLAWGVWAANDFRGLPGAGVFLVVALGLPLLFLTQALVRIYEGGQPGAVLRAFLWQPAWWSFWYPRRLRRRDDVWEQLPPAAKRLNAFGAFLFVASGVVVPFAIGAMLSPSLAASLGYGLIAPLVGVSAAIVYVLLAIDRFGRGLGLSSPVAQRLVLGPRSPALLRRPEVAQLLAGGAIANDESTTGPRAATEYVQEIGERARMLSGPARALGVQATAAARSLHAAMRALDADLESAVAPSEIEARVRELGEESEDEPSDRRLLRQFLRTQLAEARQAQQRQGGVAARRAELLDLLKNLHRMTQQLGRVSPEAVAGGELEERLRVVLRLAEKVGAPGPGDRSAS